MTITGGPDGPARVLVFCRCGLTDQQHALVGEDSRDIEPPAECLDAILQCGEKAALDNG